MARRKKTRSEPAIAAPATHADAVPPPLASAAVPGEVRDSIVVTLLALMMFVTPTLGVPNEEMLQDTLKSILVSAAALAAALLFFSREARARPALRWHAALWLPLMLMVYALGSMAWSHTYLAGVEAIRWFVFALLAWLGLNTLARERLPLLAWGVHAGALGAALWAALQFWADLRLFPQGPHPASTFVNRNFFAEFAVCTLPFGALLLARARRSPAAALLAASIGFVIVAIMMTGTRSALATMWLQLLLVLPAIAWRCRRSFAFHQWSRGMTALVLATLLGTVAVLGSIPTGDAKIAEEGRGLTALERGFGRTASISTNDQSLGIREIMWRATMRVIAAHPLAGVGAGAWENEIPLYEDAGSQLETDYYAHNEYLQLLAEYGLVGWAFLVALFGWILAAAWRTLTSRGALAEAEAPWRGVLLASLLDLLIISNIGFPWRMATTGALFAVLLGALAASDARLGLVAPWAVSRLRWRPEWSRAAGAATVAAIGLAAYISWEAAQAEYRIVHATRMALSISASGRPNDPRWAPVKQEMLDLLRGGIAINRHYRKITPMVADELARWGDWKDAIWIWESVLSSRPHVVAMMANVARGYATLGQNEQALAWLARAKQIQPRATSVRSLEVILLARTGHSEQALALARAAVDDKVYDYDMANAAFSLAWQAQDWELARRAMHLRMIGWPATRAEGYFRLAAMYDQGMHDDEQAIGAYRQALAAASPAEREAFAAAIPAKYAARLGVPPGAAGHTSASKG
jgi:O-antigen ligase